MAAIAADLWSFGDTLRVGQQALVTNTSWQRWGCTLRMGQQVLRDQNKMGVVMVDHSGCVGDSKTLHNATPRST